jgi:ABC-2 type transport system permease protein
MTTPSNAMPGSPLESQGIDSQRIALAPLSPTRPLYWSIRRELWENRSIYIAPLVAAALGMLAFFVNLIYLPRTLRALPGMDPGHQHMMIAMPYGHLAWLLIPTAFIVGVFYSLDALHGERRDRSILFWKSLPVSDLTTVLSKASIPLVILPLLVFAIAVILHLMMLLLSTAVLLLLGGAAPLWAHLPLFQMELVLLYGLVVIALWHAPLYAWLLLVSAWARRATFLWAVLPLLAIGVFEWIVFHTSHFANLLHNRLLGFAWDAFNFTTPDGSPVDLHFIPVSLLTPGRFLSRPGLWIGLIFAAIFLAAAVRLRRSSEPI